MAKKKRKAAARRTTPGRLTARTTSRARRMRAARAPAAATTSRSRSNLPDTASLAMLSPTDPSAHPSWVKTRFPTYIADHHAGFDTTIVREMAHQGHVVRIHTTYRVEVDGQPVRAHLSVDEDGRVFTHATPFVTYASALDLMRAVIDGYPESFEGTPGEPGHPDHGNHGEHGAHGGGHAGHGHMHGGHQ